MMRIGVFMLNKSGHGGAEKHTAELATRLHRRGHEVALIASRTVLAAMTGMTTIASPSVPLEEFAPEDLASHTGWRRVLGGSAFDAIVLEKGHINQGTRAFHRAARACASFYLVVEQSRAFPPEKLGGRYLGILPKLELWRHRIIRRHRRNARHPHRIICVSEENRQAFIRDFGYPADRCIVVHNCVDTERFQPDSHAPARLRAELGVPETTRLLAAVGRLSHQKNQSLILDAFRRLLDVTAHLGDVRLLLVGDGEDEAMLKVEVEQLGLSSKVVFYGRTSTPEGVMAGVDYLVLGSRHEGLPLTVAEAFACGCPAIATDAGGTREIVSSPEVGWLVPSEDADALSAALAEALAVPPTKRLAMGKVCRELAFQSFNADIQYGIYVDMFEEFMGR